ncbi:MAG: ethanolamine ammonia-lyase subunit EutC [Pirellulales bacterium]
MSDELASREERDSALVQRVRAATPARLFVGRAGGSYRTATQLQLRSDHAAAVDAVWRELDLVADWGAAFCREWDFCLATTLAATKDEYLRRPDRGRRLSADSWAALREALPGGCDLQIIVGDGLSAAAVARQTPRVLPSLVALARDRGWTIGRPVFVRHCRVGVLNDVGEVLRPRVAALLIGERPGLATAESLSAYLAYEPRSGHTDAQRNLISNIHDRGVPPEAAASRIAALAALLMRRRTSGVTVKEEV